MVIRYPRFKKHIADTRTEPSSHMGARHAKKTSNDLQIASLAYRHASTPHDRRETQPASSACARCSPRAGRPWGLAQAGPLLFILLEWSRRAAWKQRGNSLRKAERIRPCKRSDALGSLADCNACGRGRGEAWAEVVAGLSVGSLISRSGQQQLQGSGIRHNRDFAA